MAVVPLFRSITWCWVVVLAIFSFPFTLPYSPPPPTTTTMLGLLIIMISLVGKRGALASLSRGSNYELNALYSMANESPMFF